MIRILVTGSRRWTDRRVIFQALAKVIHEHYQRDRLCLVHGACPTGADQIADEIWRGWMRTWAHRTTLAEPERYPAQWTVNGRVDRAAGFRRNAQMVASRPDICLAFPLGPSPGTRHAMGLIEREGIPLRVFEKVPVA